MSLLPLLVGLLLGIRPEGALSVGPQVLRIAIGGPAAVRDARLLLEPLPEGSVRHVKADGLEAHLELPPGRYRVRVDAPGLWAEEQIVRLPGHGTANVALYPASEIKGRFVVDERDRALLPPDVSIAIGQEGTASRIHTICRLGKNQDFACPAPAIVGDLAIELKGFVPEYRWNVELETAKRFDVGEIKAYRGASISGFVAADTGSPIDPKSCVVYADPGDRPDLEVDPNRRALRRRRATVNKRGFFQIVGLQPGTYQLQAGQKGSGVARTSVDVKENAEARLREPILLRQPAVLLLHVTPALDFEKKPWLAQVSLKRFQRRTQPIRSFALDESGTAQFPGLTYGDYLVEIFSSAGVRWARREVSITMPSELAEFTLGAVYAEGTLRRGTTAVPNARISFGGSGPGSLVFRSDSDGGFSGLFPYTGTWPVEVETSEPVSVVNPPAVEIRRKHEGSVDAEPIDIRLPETTLEGFVADDAGNPVPGAIIQLIDSRTTAGGTADADGRFTLSGFAPGHVSVLAQTFDGKESDTAQLDVEPGQTRDVNLVVGDLATVEGIVTSFRTGAPIGGALVLYMPDPLNAVHDSSRAYTGPDGRFSLKVPRQAADLKLIVLASGFALRAFHTPRPQGTLPIELEDRGGTLNITWKPDGHSTLVLFRDDISLILAQGLLGGTGGVENGTGRWSVPMLEAGTYSACLLAPQEIGQGAVFGPFGLRGCAAADLTPLGEATLKPGR